MLFSVWICCVAATILMMCPSEWTNGSLRHPRTAAGLAFVTISIAATFLGADPMRAPSPGFVKALFIWNPPFWALVGIGIPGYRAFLSPPGSPVFTCVMGMIGLATVGAFARGAMAPTGTEGFLPGLERSLFFSLAGLLSVGAGLLFAARAARLAWQRRGCSVASRT